MVNKTKIKAKVVADSLSPQGDRLTSLLITFPRIILAEVNTHRMLSKNTSSSRAIPFKKMVESVEDDPFIPIAWQKRHSGMQGSEYFTDTEMPNSLEKDWFKNRWLEARDNAVNQAIIFNNAGVTKQLANRLLEPFMWHTVLLTGTEFENFFELRCPLYQTPVSQTVEPQRSWKDLEEVHSNPINLELLENNRDDYTFKLQHNKGQAEIHMMALAEAMWDAYNESTPKELKEGEWHIPFGDKLDESKIRLLHYGNIQSTTNVESLYNDSKIKIATARCARLSYMTFDGKIDYEKDIKLHDTLLESQHMSPFEHCARAMSNEEYQFFIKGKGIPDYNLGISSSNPVLIFRKNEEGWCNNFKGFIQYRYLIENFYDGFKI